MKLKGDGREIQAKDVMQSKVICVSPEQSLAEVRDLFLRHRITGAPVVDAEGLAGVISLSDIVRVALSKENDDFPENSYFIGLPPLYGAELHTLHEQMEERTVEEAMTTEVFTVTPEDRLSTIAVTMRHHRIHRLIVVDGNKVAGIVSALDLIQVLEDH